MEKSNKSKKERIKKPCQLRRLHLEQLASVAGGPIAIIRKEG